MDLSDLNLEELRGNVPDWFIDLIEEIRDGLKCKKIAELERLTQEEINNQKDIKDMIEAMDETISDVDLEEPFELEAMRILERKLIRLENPLRLDR